MNVNFLQCNLANYQKGREEVEYIVVHYTGGLGGAEANAQYFAYNELYTSSAHFFIDNDSIWLSVPMEDTAWHCGNEWMNGHSIGIEVCSNGEDFTEKEIENLHELVCFLMEKFDVDKEHVIRHYDTVDYAPGYTLDPHKHCPAPYIDNEKWFKLRDTICDCESEDDCMQAIYRPDGKDYMVWYDGVNLHALCDPYEMEAVQKFYKAMTGKEIPVFEFGTEEAPWAHRFEDAVQHGFNQKHM